MYDVVVQGPPCPTLLDVLKCFDHPSVGKIIYSSWSDNPPLILPSHITYIQSAKPPLAGGGNVNLQVVSAREGIKHATSELVLKTRSDVLLGPSCLSLLEDYHAQHQKLLTLGIAPTHLYPFMTHDFIYFGQRQEVELLFSCLLDNNLNHYPDLHKAIIPEIYITSHYIATKEPVVREFCRSPQKYLVQGSPGFDKLSPHSTTLVPKYFHPLPAVDYTWTKLKDGKKLWA